MKRYEMANERKCFWIPLSEEEPPFIGKGQLIGVQKDKHWHFAVSGSVKLFPFQAVAFRSHIIFSQDGQEAIANDSIQHRARRKQGKTGGMPIGEISFHHSYLFLETNLLN